MDDKADEGIFIWLESSEACSKLDTQLLVERLQQIITDVRVFYDPDECVDTILSLPNEIFFVGLGSGRSYLVSTLETIQQVQYIYMSEPNECAFKMKVRGVICQLNELLHQLEHDVRICEDRHTHLTTCAPDMMRPEASTQNLQQHMARFMWSQTLLEMLLRMPSSENNKNKDLIDELRRLFQKNSFQIKRIDEFECTYTAVHAINWYTKTSFLYKVLNKVLRTQNIIIIYKFRSLIQDIYKQLREMQKKQLPFTAVQVSYRGQKITPNELIELQQCVGGLVSMNTFMSTSINPAVAMSFLDLEDRDPLFKNVVFEYLIDPNLPFADLPPFANISRCSIMPDENEVLLSMGTVARIESIVADKAYPHIHHIRLCLCQPEECSLQQFKTWLSRQLPTSSLNESGYIYQLSFLLFLMGEYDKAEQLSYLFSQRSDVRLHPMQSLLTTVSHLGQRSLQLDDVDSWGPIEMRKIFDELQVAINNPQVPQYLRPILNMVNNLLKSIKPPWDNNDTDENKRMTHQQIDQGIQNIQRLYSVINTFCPAHPVTTRCEHLLGELRSLQGDHIDAVTHYERALTMSDSTMGEDHPLRAFLSNEMAESIRHIGNDDDSAQILHEALTNTDTYAARVATLHTLAKFHEERKDWSAAIACYQDIIDLPNLSPNSLEIVRAYYAIGDAFFFMANISGALRNYQCAYDRLRQHHPEEHPLFNDIQARMTIVQHLLTSVGQHIPNTKS